MDALSTYRYEQLADLITGMIANGTLTEGARVPSVRALSKQHGVSISTALQTYRTLEDRGVLMARPQSGFYVAAMRQGVLGLPSTSPRYAKASAVSISGAVAALLEHSSNRAFMPFGCAVPDGGLLASKRLDLMLSRAARRHGTQHNVYGPSQGEMTLRGEIAKRAMQVGHMLSPDDIVVTSGCTEALTLALSAVAKPGDTIAVEAPTYMGLLHTLEMLGLKALELPVDPVRGIDVEAVAQLLDTQQVAACALSSCFNNPLGSMMAEADKRALLALLARHAIPLIEDDVYGDLYFGRERPKPFVALDGGANTIYCSSFSKSLAPGYRVGWVAVGSRTRRVVERKLAFSLCSAVLPQIALAEFLASGAYDAHLRSVRRLFQDNLAQMARAVAESFPPDTRMSRPAGGFVLWLELPRGFDSRALFDAAIDQGICFAPGDVFSASRRFRNCLRLSAGHGWNDHLKDGIRRLGGLARELM
jgi:DNA-binding transcriptional MocR family regulator